VKSASRDARPRGHGTARLAADYTASGTLLASADVDSSRETIVRTLSLLTATLVIAQACTAEPRAGSTADTSSAAQPATPPAADTTTSPAQPTPSDTWTVTPSGIGPIRVGMSLDDLRRVAGDVTGPGGAGASCAYVHPSSAPRGVSVMLAKGKVTRVDVDSAGVKSDAGISVGDSVARVNEAYSGLVTVTPHKYVQGGQVLAVKPSSPQDSTFRIVFEAEGGRIARFRSGRVPEVEWVERCG
jgi:hypothetical protein